MLSHHQVRNRFLGALMGLAVGDALGSPYHKHARFQLEKQTNGDPEMVGGGPYRLKPGEWTLDTNQVLLLLTAYSQTVDLDEVDFLSRFQEWVETNPPMMELSTREIIQKWSLEDGDEWIVNSRNSWYDSGGAMANNEALCRAVGVVLGGPPNLKRIEKDLLLAIRSTHYDPRCVESALCLTFLIYELITGKFRKDTFAETCLIYLRQVTSDLSFHAKLYHFDKNKVDENASIGPLIAYREDPEAVFRVLEELPGTTELDLRNSGYVIDTLRVGIWLLANSDSFEEGVKNAVLFGGESAHQGALAGALLGGRFGLSSIPDKWLQKVQHRAKLINLAETLLAKTFVQK